MPARDAVPDVPPPNSEALWSTPPAGESLPAPSRRSGGTPTERGSRVGSGLAPRGPPRPAFSSCCYRGLASIGVSEAVPALESIATAQPVSWPYEPVFEIVIDPLCPATPGTLVVFTLRACLGPSKNVLVARRVPALLQ